MKQAAMTGQPLLPVWQKQLAAIEQRLLQGSQNPWLDQVRAKILRYLISRYGQQSHGQQGDAKKVLTRDRTGDDRPTFYVSPDPLGVSRISGHRIRELVWNIHDSVHPNSGQYKS